jgi:hypothetical protein
MVVSLEINALSMYPARANKDIESLELIKCVHTYYQLWRNECCCHDGSAYSKQMLNQQLQNKLTRSIVVLNNTLPS